MSLIKRSQLHCPHCHSHELVTSAVSCPKCQLEVSGPLIDNEFTRLSEEELHFLRVFLYCEGKIKDAEKALGLSYPSVKAKMQNLKEKLQFENGPQKHTRAEILEQMNRGDMSYEEGLKQLKSHKE